jgi:hypothetical protein
MIKAFRTQTANVTTLVLVTVAIVVTSKTIAPQHLSPLSPVSPLFILAIHARDKGLGPTDDTCDSGDTGDTHQPRRIIR